MALELVKVRARTRGKSPQEFTYEGYGKTEARKVMDKDGNPVKREDGTEVEVDDLNVEGIVTAEQLPEVLNLFDGNMVKVLEAAITLKNLENRKAASPVQEQVTEDELTPYINAMLEEGILQDKDVAVWRRTLTMSCNMFEWTKLEGMEKTKEFKALKKAGKVPEPITA